MASDFNPSVVQCLEQRSCKPQSWRGERGCWHFVPSPLSHRKSQQGEDERSTEKQHERKGMPPPSLTIFLDHISLLDKLLTASAAPPQDTDKILPTLLSCSHRISQSLAHIFLRISKRSFKLTPSQ